MLLKEAISNKGLNQQQVCDVMGMTNATLCNLEAGRAWPSKDTRRKLEDLLGPGIDWFATRAQCIDFSGGDDSTSALLLNISEWVFATNSIPPADRVQYLIRALKALEKTLKVENQY